MQSEDFLNLFTLNSLTPRNVPPTPQTPLDQQNADILKRINMLLGDSLDLNNLNFNVPMYKDCGLPNMNGNGTFTGNDLITNYPTLAGMGTGMGGGAQGMGYSTQQDVLSSMVNARAMETTPIKPCRAIRGDQTYASTPADDRRMKERMFRTPNQKHSLFDDTAYANYTHDKPMGMPPGMKTRTSPTDSDTSGISSDTSALSESYLIDLMNSLTISPPSSSVSQLDQNANEFYRQQAMLQNANYGADMRFPGDSATTLVSPKLLSKPKITDVSHLFMTDCSDPNSIERAARLYRSAASICEATCTWSGQLPLRINQREPIYSCKVFLGGIPWDITEAGLERCFKPFGPVRVEWPGKDGKHPRFGSKDIRGYAYLLFESDKCVKNLLDNCSRDVLGGEYYYKVPSKRLPGKKVQVIPWILSDSNYVCQLTDRLDTNKTVFVGALHGMINAEALATIMNDLFGDVIYAGIDLDKHKYPIGSGRVTFSTMRSYMKAVCAAFVEVKTLKFTKTIQIDPYLEEDTLCQNCNYQKGRFFCRDQQCFRYYCQACWQWQHTSELLSHHKPLMRYKKNNGKDQQNQQPTNTTDFAFPTSKMTNPRPIRE